MKTKNIHWHAGNITKEAKEDLLGFKNKVIWFTGLSGSGKSTIAREVEKKLHNLEILSYVLDGDNIRHGLNADLGFSIKDRNENIRRISEVAKLFYDAGVTVIICAISPLKEQRDKARTLVGKDFIEIFVDCPIEECEKRDVKCLYKKAREGKIKEFTGISSEYENPENPEIIIKSKEESIDESVGRVIKFLKIK